MTAEKKPFPALSLLAGITLLYIAASLLCRKSMLFLAVGGVVLSPSVGDLVFPLLLTALAALIQWSLQAFSSRSRQWLPLGIGLPCLVLAELLGAFWSSDGEIPAILLLAVAAPLCLGALLALGITRLQGQSRLTRRIAAGAAAVMLALCLWAWPRTISSRLDAQPTGTAAFYRDGVMVREVQLKPKAVDALVRRRKTGHTFRHQPWQTGNAIAVQLNDDYLLLVPQEGNPGIYAYTGQLDAFALTRPKWVVYAHSSCYQDLLRNTSGW